MQWGTAGEPDGFNVVRTLTFSGPAAAFLIRVMPNLNDPRISDYESVTDGDDSQIAIHFVGTRVADGVDPYPLDAASVVADSQEEPEEKQEEKPSAKVRSRSRNKPIEDAPLLSGEPVIPTPSEE